MIGDKKNISAHDGFAIDNSGKNNIASVILKSAHKLPSLLNPLIEKIIEEEGRIERNDDYEIPDIEDKISFNSVIVYAEDLRDSAGYMSVIEELIDAVDNERPNAKSTFLKAIKRNYDTHKKALLVEHSTDPADLEATQNLICDNADKLIQLVANTILDHASSHLTYSVELVQSAQELIVGYGFINCKILERPQ